MGASAWGKLTSNDLLKGTIGHDVFANAAVGGFARAYHRKSDRAEFGARPAGGTRIVVSGSAPARKPGMGYIVLGDERKQSQGEVLWPHGQGEKAISGREQQVARAIALVMGNRL